MKTYELNIVRNGTIFDLALSDDRIAGKLAYWVMENGIKKIEILDARPYLLALDGEKVRALTLHFQGGCKSLMRFYMTARPLSFRLRWVALVVKEVLSNTMNALGVRLRHYRKGFLKRMRRMLG